jgi:hypothetical protein
LTCYGDRIELLEIGSTINRKRWVGYTLEIFLIVWGLVYAEVCVRKIRLVGFNVIDFLQHENFLYQPKTAQWYQTMPQNLIIITFQLSTTLGKKIINMNIKQLPATFQNQQNTNVVKKFEIDDIKTNQPNFSNANLGIHQTPNDQKYFQRIADPTFTINGRTNLQQLDAIAITRQRVNNKIIPLPLRISILHFANNFKQLHQIQHHPKSLIAEHLQKTPNIITNIAIGEIQSDLTNTQFLQLPNHINIDHRIFNNNYADANEINKHMMANNQLITSFRA